MKYSTWMRLHRSLTHACVCFGALALVSPAAHAALTISKKPTQNVTCSGRTCRAKAEKAILNITDLANMLASGDVKIVSGSKAQDIEFQDAMTWGSATRLTLDSYRSVEFDAPITVAGTGALTITVSDGGSGGDFFFAKKGHIEFWDLSSTLVINGTRFILVNEIKEIAKSIAKKPSGAYALAKTVNAKRLGAFSNSPIPTSFTGSFEGLGNAIYGLTITTKKGMASVGLFAELDSGAVLRDLVLSKCLITASRAQAVGTLVGAGYLAKLIRDSVDANVVSGAYGSTGIMAGVLSGEIDHSTTIGTVKGNNLIGGIVGGFGDGTIANSHSDAAVNARSGVGGGLVGDNTGEIDNSYATGTIAGTGSAGGGGLVGLNQGLISQSFATGSVSGEGANLGGLVGATEYSSVENSYSTGAVSGGANSQVGGLIGDDWETVEYSYSTGLVTAGVNSSIGGFIGYLNYQGGSLDNIYWDLDTSGVSDPSQGVGNWPDYPYITGLTDAQLKSGLPTGFDPLIWAESPNINNGYPYLIANPPPH